MKTICIINPVAGQGKALKVWSTIQEKVFSLGFKVDTVYTKYTGHATTLASHAVQQGYELVLAVGGDGTMHEVVNGLAYTDTTFGVIPAGTGNDFGRSLMLPKDPVEAVKVIAAGKTKYIDLGRYDGHYFLNMGGFGIDADVAHRVNGTRILRGHLAYLAAALKVFMVYKSYIAEIIIDGNKIKTDTILVSVGNGQFLGGGLHMLPQAVLDDGLLDIMIVEKMPRLELIKRFPSLYKGTHLMIPKCHFYRGREVIINLPEPKENVFAQVDGQEISGFPLHFGIAPQALKVFIP